MIKFFKRRGICQQDHIGNEKKSKGTLILFIILIILIIVIGGLLALKIIERNNTLPVQTIDETSKQEEVEIVEPQVQIYSGTDRPIAVMIDNNKNAWPQAGLNDAYIVYEIVVEGAETRLMALFKGKDLERIGPIRSSRHYFLDYALENDAIYVHYGWSPQAESDISKYNVDNVNGLVQSSSDFWRDKEKYQPHNAVTATANILKIAERYEYRLTSEEESVLNYVTDEVELEDGIIATNVYIPTTSYVKATYQYNPETKRYTRYERGEKATDWNTEEEITTKNIIITFADNYTLQDAENKGRQGLNNVGQKDGYYITNGKAIKIICDKPSRTEKTVYKDLQGNEIEVNDGNTFIQICPTNTEVTFE